MTKYGYVARTFLREESNALSPKYYNIAEGGFSPSIGYEQIVPEDIGNEILSFLSNFSAIYTVEFVELTPDQLQDHLAGLTPPAEVHLCECCGTEEVEAEGYTCTECDGDNDDYDSECDTRDYTVEDEMAAWSERYDMWRNEY